MKISVKAHPKAKKEEVKKIDEMRYEVWVREAPDKGRANEAVLSALAEYFNLSRIKLRLIRGQTSKHKIVEI